MTAEPAISSVAETAQERGGKYLSFGLDDTEYGLEILKVREIIGMIDITVVPRTPESVRGVMNLRGKIIPVLDLRQTFAIPSLEDSEETRIVVVEIGGVEVGIVVDAVREVLDILEEDIEDVPSFGLRVNTDFVLGMGKKEGRVTILLDIDKLLTSEQASALQTIEHAGTESPHAEQPL